MRQSLKFCSRICILRKENSRNFMRKERREKEKKELEQFRYLKILGDCFIKIYDDTIQLKKGDIIKIYNSDLEDVVFEKGAGILFELGYRGDGEKPRRMRFEDPFYDFRLKKYPIDKPLDIMEYLRMQPKVKLPVPMQLSMWIDSDVWVYLTPEIINRMFNDEENSVKLMDGNSMRVADYNKRVFKKNLDIRLQKAGRRQSLLEFTDDSHYGLSSNNQRKDTFSLVTLEEGIEPGIYRTESSYLPLTIVLPEGNIIDFSKLEYALSALNQSFMRVLANSKEITSLRTKKRINEDEQQDFIFDTETNEKQRYYRLNDDVNIDIKSISKLARRWDKESWEDVINIGNDYDYRRVSGEIEAVETENGRVSVIKVTYWNPATYSIMDKELQKISRRLPEKEAFRMYIKERTAKQKASEEKMAQEAIRKDKDYFRTKMIADLARTYVSKGNLTSEFKEKANEYDKDGKKSYKIFKLLGIWLSEEEIYMMHIIGNKKDNRVLKNEYEEELGQQRAYLTKIFKGISKKGEQR